MSTKLIEERFLYREITDEDDDKIQTKLEEISNVCNELQVDYSEKKRAKGHYIIEIIPVRISDDYSK
jgi:hypothetical protein